MDRKLLVKNSRTLPPSGRNYSLSEKLILE